MEGRKVKNRDVVLLCRVLPTMQLVCSLEKRSLWQRERMYKITAQLSGTPRGGQGPMGIDGALAALEGAQERCEEAIKNYVRSLRAAEKIVNGIESPLMRAFVVMYYMDNMSASVVQRELNMTRRGFERARTAIEEAPDMARVVWREKLIREG